MHQSWNRITLPILVTALSVMGLARALEGFKPGTLGHLRLLLIAVGERLLLPHWKVLLLAARFLVRKNQPQRAAMPHVARTHGLPAAAVAVLLPLTILTSQQAALHRQALAFLLLLMSKARSRAQGSSSTRSKQPWGCRQIWLLVVVRAAQLQLPRKAC